MEVLFRDLKDVIADGFPSPELDVVVEDLVRTFPDHADQPVVHGTVVAEHHALAGTAVQQEIDIY